MNLNVFIPDFSNLGGWGYFFVLVLLFSATPIPIFSTELIVMAAGALANPIIVGIVAGVAGAVGELSTYFIGLGGEKVISRRKKEGKKYNQAVDMFEKWGFGAIVIFAFTPLPMDFIGLVAGGLHYNIKKFFLGALIGKIPRFILIAYAGSIGMQLFF